MSAADRRVELVDQIQKGMGVSRTRARVIADALLESDWLAERDRRVAAQTLRDAADALTASPDHARWLRDRADTTEGTHHAND